MRLLTDLREDLTYSLLVGHPNPTEPPDLILHNPMRANGTQLLPMGLLSDPEFLLPEICLGIVSIVTNPRHRLIDTLDIFVRISQALLSGT